MSPRSWPFRLKSAAGLRLELNANGSLRRIDHEDVVVNLFLRRSTWSTRRTSGSRTTAPCGSTSSYVSQYVDYMPLEHARHGVVLAVRQNLSMGGRHPWLLVGSLLSFFTGENAQVVLRAKELALLRPHGQILRTGSEFVPDEAALTWAVWMAGVFQGAAQKAG